MSTPLFKIDQRVAVVCGDALFFCMIDEIQITRTANHYSLRKQNGDVFQALFPEDHLHDATEYSFSKVAEAINAYPAPITPVKPDPSFDGKTNEDVPF